MSKRILFIDDDLNFLNGIKRMLHNFISGWEICSAQGVEAALPEIGKAAFDVIISDMTMPGKNGFDLLRILQESEDYRDIPVIILTGNNEENLKSEALQLGATDLLNKPVSRGDLVARLQNSLRLKSYQDQLKDQNKILDQKVQERTSELEESRLDIILRLGKAAEYRDTETGNHILRVGCYCRALAQEMDMEREFAEMILLAAPMHDIGKIGIPDRVLQKSGIFTAQERSIMERHCAIGHEILQNEPEGLKPFLQWHRDQETIQRLSHPLLDMTAQIALSHHEKWDGSGYPQGLKDTEIPLPARIAALADVYDALRSARPYKQAFSEEKAVEILTEESAAHFDPMVFAAFTNIREIFNTIHAQFIDETSKEEILPV